MPGAVVLRWCDLVRYDEAELALPFALQEGKRLVPRLVGPYACSGLGFASTYPRGEGRTGRKFRRVRTFRNQ